MVKPKKHLGQHFLTDENTAKKIVDGLKSDGNLIEIGPGKGVLSKYLMDRENTNTYFLDLDTESIEYLKEEYPESADRVIEADFLKYDLTKLFPNQKFNIIGNFPYNISSQIFFKILTHRNEVDECVGMIQKEVGERIAEKPGSKTYGILSVLLQAFYNIEYLFTVNEGVFFPPPKVKSAVIRLTRNNVKQLDCNEDLFIQVVKAGFNQRRKTLRNALKGFNIQTPHELLTKRAEQLTVADFVILTNLIQTP
ncbi:MAG: 16S rRNA (adenine(1518)-N(6)/adenine(1519)-N(6))-dimethyltransferase [Bacteroidetes bacterium]|nr:16S rRNA (adenine(1518)-N(6)/adenine(1519)-N(6))-dimethyltransferase [Bacteroidota bacterium]